MLEPFRPIPIFSSLQRHHVKSVQMWSFTWSVFSYIQAKSGDSQSKCPYSVQMWEITNQKKFRVWTLSRSVILGLSNTVTLNRNVTSIKIVFPSFFIYQIIMSWLLSSNLFAWGNVASGFRFSFSRTFSMLCSYYF